VLLLVLVLGMEYAFGAWGFVLPMVWPLWVGK
jgi:hypothetical protein